MGIDPPEVIEMSTLGLGRRRWLAALGVSEEEHSRRAVKPDDVGPKSIREARRKRCLATDQGHERVKEHYPRSCRLVISQRSSDLADTILARLSIGTPYTVSSARAASASADRGFRHP